MRTNPNRGARIPSNGLGPQSLSTRGQPYTAHQDSAESARLALPHDIYLMLKQQKMLHLALPNEACTCGTLDGALSSLLAQYNVDDLMTIRKPEFKKGKELFLACLFAYIIRDANVLQRQYDICIPTTDTGIDIYIREIDRQHSLIIHHPIQICEMPERYLKWEKHCSTPAQQICEFIKKTKLSHYQQSSTALLVWLEFDAARRLNMASLREMMKHETTMPFSQIVLMGRGNGDLFNILSAYSSDTSCHFSFSYDYKTRKTIRLADRKERHAEQENA